MISTHVEKQCSSSLIQHADILAHLLNGFCYLKDRIRQEEVGHIRITVVKNDWIHLHRYSFETNINQFPPFVMHKACFGLPLGVNVYFDQLAYLSSSIFRFYDIISKADIEMK